MHADSIYAQSQPAARYQQSVGQQQNMQQSEIVIDNRMPSDVMQPPTGGVSQPLSLSPDASPQHQHVKREGTHATKRDTVFWVAVRVCCTTATRLNTHKTDVLKNSCQQGVELHP